MSNYYSGLGPLVLSKSLSPSSARWQDILVWPPHHSVRRLGC